MQLFRTRRRRVLFAQQSLDVARAVDDMDNIDTIPFCLIENEPVLKTLHGPAAKAACGWSAKAAQNSQSRHVSQRLETVDELVQETLGGFQSGLFFKIFKMRIDFAPCERPHRKPRHL